MGGESVDRPPFEQELAAETGRIRRLHALLATELAAATAQARGSLAAPTGGQLSARWERDVSVHRWSERVSALTAARSGLCFGRLDHTDGSTSYIGRIGLTDPADGESALIDWRAPAARPFYCATLATPLGRDPATAFPARRNGARRAGRRFPRRCAGPGHRFRIRVRSGAARRAEGAARVDDARHRDDDPGRAGRDHPAAALRRRRDRGRPGDREDRGGAAPRRLPALHPSRAAGPQRRAGRRPQRRVHPVRRGRAPRAGRVGGGVHHPRPAGARRRRDRRRSRTRWPATKGGLAMLDVLRRAVADRQELPGSPIAIELDDVTVEIDRATAAEARRRARATGLPHNAARTTFRDTLGSLLVDAGRRAAEPGPGGPARARRAPPRARRPPGDRAGGRGGGVGGDARRAARRPARGPRLPRGGRAALAGADPGAGPRRALRVAGAAGLGGRRDRPLRAVPRRGLPRGRWRTRRCSTSWPSCSVPRPARPARPERDPTAPTPRRC